MPVPIDAEERHDVKAMLAAVTDRTRLVLVCSPNNPTGPVVRRDELEWLLGEVPDGVLVVLDEAYHEFVRDPLAPDGARLYRERPNLCVLRTFSKAYGLAALRVGYALASEPVAEALRKTAVPFGVSAVAEEAAIASLDAADEMQVRVDAIVGQRRRVLEALRDQGWVVPASEANFVWLRLGEHTDAFAAACAEGGVVVRPFAGEGVRVTVGEPAADDAFLAVAGRWAATTG